MKLFRILALVATGVLVWRMAARRLGLQLQSMSHPLSSGWTGKARGTDKRFSIERKPRTASSSRGQWRDDRDVMPPVTSPLHEEELSGR